MFLKRYLIYPTIRTSYPLWHKINPLWNWQDLQFNVLSYFIYQLGPIPYHHHNQTSKYPLNNTFSLTTLIIPNPPFFPFFFVLIFTHTTFHGFATLPQATCTIYFEKPLSSRLMNFPYYSEALRNRTLKDTSICGVPVDEWQLPLGSHLWHLEAPFLLTQGLSRMKVLEFGRRIETLLLYLVSLSACAQEGS